jgi:hypothetical protein
LRAKRCGSERPPVALETLFAEVLRPCPLAESRNHRLNRQEQRAAVRRIFDELRAGFVRALRLVEIGVQETERNLNNKISRGEFTATFILQVMQAIGSRELRPD